MVSVGFITGPVGWGHGVPCGFRGMGLGEFGGVETRSWREHGVRGLGMRKKRGSGETTPRCGTLE